MLPAGFKKSGCEAELEHFGNLQSSILKVLHQKTLSSSLQMAVLSNSSSLFVVSKHNL